MDWEGSDDAKILKLYFYLVLLYPISPYLPVRFCSNMISYTSSTSFVLIILTKHPVRSCRFHPQWRSIACFPASARIGIAESLPFSCNDRRGIHMTCRTVEPSHWPQHLVVQPDKHMILVWVTKSVRLYTAKTS